MSISVNLGNGTIIDGAAPVVLIGANGVGKTRFGTFLVSSFGYDRVPALRGLSVASIPMWALETARRETDALLQSSRANTSDIIGDLQHLLADLKAEDAHAATVFRKKAIETQGNAGVPEPTRLDILARLWGLVFPGRALDLTTYEPKASWTDPARGTSQYSTAHMSDGERSALYLIARVLRANPGVVVIDEPEVHFHTLLARQFWDVVEAERSDCRFVYITHDLAFALSRRGRVGIVRAPNRVELIDENAPIPTDLFESILGAASLSVVAKRIVFCEGVHDRSIDTAFYSSWFKAPETVIIPVGSCDNVRRTFSTFQNPNVVANANPVGIVERDYWPDSHLARLTNEGLYVLPTHEVEGLLALREVALAAADHLSVRDFDEKYAEFERVVRRHFTGITLNKLILERAKRDVDTRLIGLPNKAVPDKDRAATRAGFVSVVDLSKAVPNTEAIFDEHENIVEAALIGPAADFLRIVPGKDCLTILLQQLGINKETYLGLVTDALLQPDTNGKSSLETLRMSLVSALQPYLPLRE